MSGLVGWLAPMITMTEWKASERQRAKWNTVNHCIDLLFKPFKLINSLKLKIELKERKGHHHVGVFVCNDIQA